MTELQTVCEKMTKVQNLMAVADGAIQTALDAARAEGFADATVDDIIYLWHLKTTEAAAVSPMAGVEVEPTTASWPAAEAPAAAIPVGPMRAAHQEGEKLAERPKRVSRNAKTAKTVVGKPPRRSHKAKKAEPVSAPIAPTTPGPIPASAGEVDPNLVSIGQEILDATADWKEFSAADLCERMAARHPGMKRDSVQRTLRSMVPGGFVRVGRGRYRHAAAAKREAPRVAAE